MPSPTPKTASRPTLRDIARSLNVSHTTVSRVLSGRQADYISAEMRSRVLEAADEMHYRPNRVARSLATGRTDMIAFWTGDLFHPYYVRSMQHVSEQVESSGYQTVIYHLNDPKPATLFTAADGILVLDWRLTVEDYLDYESHPLPLVSMGVHCSYRTDYVEIDPYPGAVAAVRHLVENGCRRIAFVTHISTGLSEEPRGRAYGKVMEEAGLAPEVIVIKRSFRSQCREDVRAYIQEKGAPDGVFCLSDDIALGAYRAYYDLGMRIPEDAALIGCDGIEEGEYLSSALTTVALPIPEMANTAVRFLRQRIEQPDLPLQQTVLQPTLIIRESSRAVSRA